MPLIAVCWEASSALDLGSIALDNIKNMKGNIKFSATSAVFGGVSGFAKSLLTIDNIKTVASAVHKTTVEGSQLFKKARENARRSGKILGHYLAHGLNLESYSVSLIGFSLGSQVIKSCLNTLTKFEHSPKT